MVSLIEYIKNPNIEIEKKKKMPRSEYVKSYYQKNKVKIIKKICENSKINYEKNKDEYKKNAREILINKLNDKNFTFKRFPYSKIKKEGILFKNNIYV